MAKVTLTIDDETLRRARSKALEQGTSVNAIVRDYLESFAGMRPSTAAIDAFLALTEDADSGSGSQGHRWSRDDLYENRRG
jgi:hypothetical protein